MTRAEIERLLMPLMCQFCGEPAAHACSWVVGEGPPYKWDPEAHRWAGVKRLCGVPCCFRHMVEPGDIVYCADHWRFAEILPPVADYWASRADADPLSFNRPKKKKAYA